MSEIVFHINYGLMYAIYYPTTGQKKTRANKSH